tara:strand:- start:46 stop:837 length:792 start_codon:yes stop_codon:yes gene_type:complete
MIHTHNIDPIIVSLGPIDLYWYGAMYAISFLTIDHMMKANYFNFNRYNLSYTQIDKLLLVSLVSLLLGGRLGYVIFYNLDYYILFPIKTLFIWEGGMSFHGAVLGVMFAIYWSRKSIDLHFLKLTDFTVLYVPIGLFFGRIGNFINSELYGMPTNSSWGVIFPLLDNIPRHPSMLYEALLEGIILFLILLWLSRKHSTTPGFLTSIFLIFYSIFRFMIEFVRVPDSHIGYIWSDWLTLGQLLSVPMMFFGILLLMKINRSQLA